jgi:hypothetical protein
MLALLLHLLKVVLATTDFGSAVGLGCCLVVGFSQAFFLFGVLFVDLCQSGILQSFKKITNRLSVRRLKLKREVITILLLALICSLVLIGTVQFSKAEGGTKVRGIIYTDTTWQKSSSPYDVTGALSINTGVTLTIEPGVIIYLNGNYIQVNGTLSARGTATEPINFVNGTIAFTNSSIGWNEKTLTGSIISNAFINDSQGGSSYGSGVLSIKQCAPKIDCVNITCRSSGNGIYMSSGAPVVSNCNITVYGTGIYAEQGSITLLNNTITVNNYGITLDHCNSALVSHSLIRQILSYISGTGILVTYSNASVYNNIVYGFSSGICASNSADDYFGYGNIKFQATVNIENNLVFKTGTGILSSISGSGTKTSYNCIKNNTLTRNSIGLKIASDSNITVIQYNNLFNNTQYDFAISTSYNINASDNWWGTIDTDRIEDKINDYTFDFDYGNVTYQPVLPGMNMGAPLLPLFTIKAVASSGGTITPNGVSNVIYSDSLSLSVSALNGFQLASISINGTSYRNGYYSSSDYSVNLYSTSGYCQFTSISASYVVEATFVSQHYTTTITMTHVGEGIISPADGSSTVELGSTLVLRATPAKEYAFMCWLQNGMLLGNSNPYNYTVTGANTITAVFYDPVAKDTPTITPTPTPTATPTPTSTPMPSPMPNAKQYVVDTLESKGFDVTFVYFGSNKTFTDSFENMAIVIMRTFEHIKNMQLTDIQEVQLKEGNNTLTKAYPNAELLKVGIFEDLDKDGIPDTQYGNNYYQRLGGGLFEGSGSWASTPDYAWNEANKFISTDGTTPDTIPTIAPTPTPTPSPTATSTPTVTPTPTTASNPTANPTSQATQNPTTNPTTQPTQNPTSNPTASPTQKLPTPSPSVPEYSAFLLLPLFVLVLCGAVAVKLKKKASEN